MNKRGQMQTWLQFAGREYLRRSPFFVRGWNEGTEEVPVSEVWGFVTWKHRMPEIPITRAPFRSTCRLRTCRNQVGLPVPQLYGSIHSRRCLSRRWENCPSGTLGETKGLSLVRQPFLFRRTGYFEASERHSTDISSSVLPFVSGTHRQTKIAEASDISA